MKSRIAVIAGGIITAGWGIVHLFPTMSVVRGFGAVGQDNRHIITMEWINEGLTLIFIGTLAVTVALSERNGGDTARRVYLLTAMMLIVMAVVSLFTGFKIDFIPFRLCPVIFTVSAVLIGQGGFRRGWRT